MRQHPTKACCSMKAIQSALLLNWQGWSLVIHTITYDFLFCVRWPEGSCHNQKKHHKTHRTRDRECTEAGLFCKTSQKRVSNACLYASLSKVWIRQKARTTRPRLAARIHALASNHKRAPRNTDHFSTSVKWRQDDLTRVRRQDAIRTPPPRRRIKLFDCQWHALFTAAAPNDQIIAATGL